MSDAEKLQGHEERDIDVVRVSIAALVLLGIVAVSLAVALQVFDAFRAQDRPRTAERQVPPEPRLQVNPREDIEAMRRAEEERLHSYGWINREAGIVRVPIGRAMTLLLNRGLPVRQADAGGERKP